MKVRVEACVRRKGKGPRAKPILGIVERCFHSFYVNFFAIAWDPNSFS